MRVRYLISLVALLLSVAACAADQAADTVAADTPSPPSWIIDLSPPPGVEWELDQRVEVTYDVPQDESVRLLIDGTDVTDDAELGDDQLTYDPQQAPTALEIGSGAHTATVERVRTGETSSEQDATLDTFTWDFEIP